jgi:hypothetical protein
MCMPSKMVNGLRVIQPLTKTNRKQIPPATIHSTDIAIADTAQQLPLP